MSISHLVCVRLADAFSAMPVCEATLAIYDPAMETLRIPQGAPADESEGHIVYASPLLDVDAPQLYRSASSAFRKTLKKVFGIARAAQIHEMRTADDDVPRLYDRHSIGMLRGGVGVALVDTVPFRLNEGTGNSLRTLSLFAVASGGWFLHSAFLQPALPMPPNVDVIMRILRQQFPSATHEQLSGAHFGRWRAWRRTGRCGRWPARVCFTSIPYSPRRCAPDEALTRRRARRA